MDVKGKTAVITGASRGLGAGLAEAFAARGMRLGLCARSMPALAGDEVVARQLDVADAAALDAFCDEVSARFGRIDLWINNAGVLEPVKFVRDLSDAELEAHLAVNLYGVLHGMRAYLRHLSGRPGVLMNISSGAALRGYAGWGAYCAGKAAVDRLSECVQLEEPSLRVYAVAPGVIDTDMQAIIRSKTKEQFPMVDKFMAMKERDAFSRPPFVAEQLLRIAFSEPPGEVVLRLPPEPR